MPNNTSIEQYLAFYEKANFPVTVYDVEGGNVVPVTVVGFNPGEDLHHSTITCYSANSKARFQTSVNMYLLDKKEAELAAQEELIEVMVCNEKMRLDSLIEANIRSVVAANLDKPDAVRNILSNAYAEWAQSIAESF